ncbi:AAA family ATPase [soil metagenome]
MTIKSLNLAGWRQFDHVSLDFHPRLTVITGGNGSGKTALLRVLARTLGRTFEELSVPVSDPKRGTLSFLASLADEKRIKQILSDPHLSKEDQYYFSLLLDQKHSLDIERRYSFDPQEFRRIGEMLFNDGADPGVILANRVTTTPTYDILILRQESPEGLFIPSHRSEYFYKTVESIPLKVTTTRDIFNRITTALHTRSTYAWSNENLPPSYYMKETLLSWAYIGFGSELIAGNAPMRSFFRSFEQILHKILPKTLKFRRLDIRTPEIVLMTDTGDFMIDAVSGGIGATLDLAWQVFIRDPTRQEKLTVVIDEVENHLHASMQRSILPGLLEAFPNSQFIVSTHSPLVVGSVKESSVYALRYNERNRVYSDRLDIVEKSGTATEILREVLDVPVTAPIWVEEYLNDAAAQFAGLEQSKETIQALREVLRETGLGEFAPLAITKLIQRWESLQ